MARARWQLDVNSLRRADGAAATHDGAGRPLLRARTLGAVALAVGDARLDPSSGTLFALLLRLVYAPAHALPREEAARSLWAGQPAARQAANLRQACYKLRRLGIAAGLVGDVVTLDPSQLAPTFALQRTVERFEEDVTRGHEPFGAFLPGYVTGWAEHDGWVTGLREVVHADVRRVLAAQLKSRRARADWMGADALARWLLQFDPLNEEATLTVAECTAMHGSKAEAVAILDRYLMELGPGAGEIRLPATLLRRRITDGGGRPRVNLAPAERHFVGREELMAELTLAMRRAKWHDGSATLLHGPPGMGKTRVAQELAKVAAIEGFRVVSVGCRESDQQRPLSVFLDLVPELLELPGAMGCDPESMRVLRRLCDRSRSPKDADENTSLFDHADTSDRRDLDAPLKADDEAQRIGPAPIRRALVELIAAVSDERPMLLVLEDLHWIDSSSVDLVRDLLDHIGVSRTFLLATSRNKSIAHSVADYARHQLRHVALEPLTWPHRLELARAISRELKGPLTTDLEEWFSSACEGSPLFLLALVHHWIETGRGGGVPPTLDQLIEQRLSALDSDSLRVVQATAMLGRHADISCVQSVLELPTFRLLAAVEALEHAGALDPTAERLRVHDLLAQRATATMNRHSATRLHLSIANALTMRFESERSREILVDAAIHLEKANQPGELLVFLNKYADELSRAEQPVVVLGILDAALATGTNTFSSRDLRRARMRLELEAGEYGIALAQRPGELALSRSTDTLDDTSADDEITRIDVAYRADPFADKEHLARHLTRLSGAANLSEEVRCRAAEVGLVIAANICDQALADAIRGHVENAYVLPASPLGQRVALLFHTIFGDREIALNLASSHVESGMRIENSPGKYQLFARAGFAFRVIGSANRALASFECALSVSEALGTRALSQYITWQVSQTHLDSGQLVDAIDWNERLRRLFADDADLYSSSFVLAHFCRMAIELGDAPLARQYLAEYTKALGRMPSLKAAAYHLALSLGCELLDSRWVPTEEMTCVAVERFAKTCRFGTSDFLAAMTANSLLRRGLVTQASLLLDDYLRSHRRETRAPSTALQNALDNLSMSR